MGYADRDYRRQTDEPPNYLRLPDLSPLTWLIIVCAILSLVKADGGFRFLFNISESAVFHQGHLWTILLDPFAPILFWGLFSLGLVLFFFGNFLAREIGFKEFLWFYWVSSLSGMLGHWVSVWFLGTSSFINPESWEWGMLSVLILFTFKHPYERVRLYFILPIQMRFLTIFIVLAACVTIISNGEGVAAFLPLIFLALHSWLYFKKKIRYSMISFQVEYFYKRTLNKLKRPKNMPSGGSSRERELDRILDKITEKGISSLTSAEKDFLKKYSKSHNGDK